MGTKLTISLTALALLLAFVAVDVSAQVVYGQPTAGGLRFVYNSWKVSTDEGDSTLSQFVTPLSGFIPLKENIDLSFFVASASNKLKVPSEELTLNGLTDFRLQGRRSFSDDRVIASLGVNLPTGKKDLNSGDEYPVLQAMSANFIELPLRRLGEGFGFNALIGGATTLGDKVKAGIGLSYQFIGKYTPYDGLPDYNPGDVFAINGSTEIVDDDLTYLINLVYSIYTTDKAEGVETFRQSPSMDIRFGLNRKDEVISYGGMARYVVRGENKAVNPLDENQIDFLKVYGNEFSFAAHLGWTMAEDWYVVPEAEVRMIGSNDINFDHSTVFGFGGSAGRQLGKNFHVNAGFKLYTGSVETFQQDPLTNIKSKSDSDVSGYRITLGLTASM